MRGSLPLTMPGQLRPRGWTEQRPRIEPDATGKNEKKSMKGFLKIFRYKRRSLPIHLSERLHSVFDENRNKVSTAKH